MVLPPFLIMQVKVSFGELHCNNILPIAIWKVDMTICIGHNSSDGVATLSNDVGMVCVAHIHLDGNSTKNKKL